MRREHLCWGAPTAPLSPARVDAGSTSLGGGGPHHRAAGLAAPAGLSGPEPRAVTGGPVPPEAGSGRAVPNFAGGAAMLGVLKRAVWTPLRVTETYRESWRGSIPGRLNSPTRSTEAATRSDNTQEDSLNRGPSPRRVLRSAAANRPGVKARANWAGGCPSSTSGSRPPAAETPGSGWP